MIEQSILLFLLIVALAATLGLFFLKSKKQAQYRNDERWQWIQLKSSDTANLSHTILLLLILFAPLFLDSQTTFTLQRVKIFALLYIGRRNMIELAATLYFDRQL